MGTQTLIVVVNRHRKHFFSLCLAYNIFIKCLSNFCWSRKFRQNILCCRCGFIFSRFFMDNVVTKQNAFIANINRGACNELAYFMLTLSAKRAMKYFTITATLIIIHMRKPLLRL